MFLNVPYGMLIPIRATDIDIKGKKCMGMTTWKPQLSLHKISGFKVTAIFP